MPWNWLQVPNKVNPVEYAPAVADVVIQTLDLPPRCAKLVHTTILRLYKSFGVLDGSRRFPTAYDVFADIRDNARANRQAQLAFLDASEPVMRSLGPEVLGYHRGWNCDELANKRIHLDFTGASEVCKNLRLNVLLLGEFSSRRARGYSNRPMDQSFTIDESGDLISASKPNLALLNAFTLVRGTGIGLDVATTSSDIHPIVLSNCANKQLGRCGSAQDYNLMASAMGLSTEQRSHIHHHLSPGVFVEQVGEGDWRYPYLVRIPKLDYEFVEDEDDSCPSDLARLPIERASVPPEFDEFDIRTPDNPCNLSPSNQEFSEPERRYVRTIIENPGQPSSAYVKLAKLGGKQAQTIRNRLVAEGYLREHQVNTGSRGRAAIVLEPLEPALICFNGSPEPKDTQ